MAQDEPPQAPPMGRASKAATAASYREPCPPERVVIRIDDHPCGPRVYVLGRRVHHGVAGIAGFLVLASAGRYCEAARSLCWAATDWRDFPFRDCDNHA